MDVKSKILIIIYLLTSPALLYAKDDPKRPKKHLDQIEQLKDPEAQYGKTSIIKQKKPHLRVNGPVQINLSEITGLTRLNGPADIKNSIFNTLEQLGPINCFDAQINSANLNGVANLTRTKVFKLNIIGTLSAHNSIFDEITAQSHKIILDNCIVHNITIIGDINYPHHQPIVELRGASTISGTIKFVEASGLVQMAGVNNAVNNIENGTTANF